MSIQSIATELYSLKSRKNISLSSAFSVMLREELAARLSVYNLVRTVTRSPLLATIAQYKFGGLTPLQKQEAEEEQKAKKSEMKFRQITATSIARLNRKINTLAAITQQNSYLIQSLYDELGGSRFRRARNVFRSSQAVRIPGRSKTVNAQIEQIQKDLAILSKQKLVPGKKKPATKTKEKEKKERTDALGGIIGALIPLLIANPRLLLAATGGTAAAVSLGSLGAQAYSLFAAPEVGGRILGRLQGERGVDPNTGKPFTDTQEFMSRYVDMGLGIVGAGTGAYIAGRAIGAGVGYASKRMQNKIRTEKMIAMRETPQGVAKVRGERITKSGKLVPSYVDTETGKFLSRKELRERRKQAAERVKAPGEYMTGFLKFLGLAKPLLRAVPAVSAAYGTYALSKMGEYIVDYEEGKMTYAEFKTAMVPLYSDLIETIGLTAFTTIIGALGGTLVGGPFGAIAGAGGGMLAGVGLSVASMFTEKDDEMYSWGAEKLFSLIHEDKKQINIPGTAQSSQRETAAVAGQRTTTPSARTPSTPSTGVSNPLSVRNNNPGNLRYSESLTRPGYVLEKAVGSDSNGFAIFATPQDGLEAMRKQVRLDTQTRKMTLAQFIGKYAPPNENDTRKYIDYISSKTGIGPNELISEAKIPQVMNAMIVMEGGRAAGQYYASVMTPPTVESEQQRVQVVQTQAQQSETQLVAEQQMNQMTDEFGNRIDNSQAMSYAALGASELLAGAVARMQGSITDLATMSQLNSDFYVDNLDSSLTNYRLS